MRQSSALLPLAASAATAFALVAAIVLSPDFAQADPAAKSGTPDPQACGCQEKSGRATRPKYAELKPPSDGLALDRGDEVAALSSVQHALSNVGDGSTYIWHRQNGRISGLIKPTSSFKGQDGAICRHIMVLLTTGNKTKKTEGIACRQSNGVWSLEG